MNDPIALPAAPPTSSLPGSSGAGESSLAGLSCWSLVLPSPFGEPCGPLASTLRFGVACRGIVKEDFSSFWDVSPAAESASAFTSLSVFLEGSSLSLFEEDILLDRSRSLWSNGQSWIQLSQDLR